MNTHIPRFERAQEAMGYDEVPLKVSFENLFKTNEAREHVRKLFHMQAPQFS